MTQFRFALTSTKSTRIIKRAKFGNTFPKNQENRTTPIPGARKVGAQGEDQTLGIYMSSFGPKFNLIPN
ncbi:hypothetical protein GQ457_08G027620 [Hibiscus cannabinus]